MSPSTERFLILARLMGAEPDGRDGVFRAKIGMWRRLGWPAPKPNLDDYARSVAIIVEETPEVWGTIEDAFRTLSAEVSAFSDLVRRCELAANIAPVESTVV
jgi:hypothetical protein